jgi:hypothetical protein
MKYYFKTLQLEKVDLIINFHNTFRYVKLRHKLLNQLTENYKQQIITKFQYIKSGLHYYSFKH